jgi:hypothetical protein
LEITPLGLISQEVLLRNASSYPLDSPSISASQSPRRNKMTPHLSLQPTISGILFSRNRTIGSRGTPGGPSSQPPDGFKRHDASVRKEHENGLYLDRRQRDEIHLLRDHTDYRDLGSTYFETRDQEQLRSSAVRRLESLGYQVTLEEVSA